MVVYHLPPNSRNFSHNASDKTIFENKRHFLKGSLKIPFKILEWKMCLSFAIHCALGIMHLSMLSLREDYPEHNPWEFD